MTDQAKYPFAPWGKTDTAIAAAAEIAHKVPSMQIRALQAIRRAGAQGMTADEAANAINVLHYTIRARTAELRAMGLIKDSKQRRQNNTGRNAIVFVATTEAEQRAFLEAKAANDAERNGAHGHAVSETLHGTGAANTGNALRNVTSVTRNGQQ